MTVLGRPWGVTVAATLLLAVIGAGCERATGGGWIMSSANAFEKATFGFSAKCRTRTGDSGPVAVFADGQLEYHDEAAGVRIHGDVEPADFAQLPGTCEDVGQMPMFMFGVATFEGTYRSQSGDEEGQFFVTVTDNGQPGMNGDLFCIELAGDIVYPEHCRPVQGGNIQVK